MTPTAASSSPSRVLSVMVSTSRTTMSRVASTTKAFLTVTSPSEPSRAWPAASHARVQSHLDALHQFPKWVDREYRHAYVEAAIEQGLAWQIRANRKSQGLSQEQLAQRIGSHQSAVSRLEDPTYGSHSIETLLSLATAFDCALSIRFVPFSTFARESLDLGPDALIAAPFPSERPPSKEDHDNAD